MIRVIENFITEEEEKELLSHCKPSSVKLGNERNRITRYGSRLPYNSHIVSDIPKWLHPLCFKIAETEEWKDVKGKLPDSVTINEYLEGQSIDWHIDSETSGAIISVISLESSAVMGMKYEGKESKIDLPARSLIQISEEERWKWKHCIYPVPSHRFSLVFRKGTPKKK